MKRVPWLPVAVTVLLASLLLSCQESTTEPVALSPSNPSLEGTLTPAAGGGTGRITLYPMDGTAGYSARVTVTVTGLLPWRSFRVQRAAEYGRPLCNDGIGQRALEMWPWEQPSCEGYCPEPAFVDGCGCVQSPVAVFMTDDQGSGYAEFVYHESSILVGSRFDVVFRMLDTVTVSHDTLDCIAPELRSACFTLEAK